MRFADVFIRRPVFATMLIASLVVLGLFSYRGLGLDLFPNIDFPIVTVTTTLKGASVEEMETGVTKVLEEAVNTIDGIDELRSITKEGLSTIVVQFVLEKSRDTAAQDVRDKVATVLAQLPVGTDPPVIDKFDVDAIPVMGIALSGRRNLREVTELARRQVKEDIETLAGVGQVIMLGGQERAINISVDPDRLTAQGLSIGEVRGAIQRQNLELPGGRLDQTRRELVVRTMGRVERAAEFGDLIVARGGERPLRVRDIGTAEDGIVEPRTLSRLNGENAVQLVVRKQSGTNTVEVIDRVQAELDRLRAVLPADIEMRGSRDQSRFIKASIETVRVHMWLGAILVALTVLLFMRDWRSTVVASIAIPTSVISTFTFMRYMGFTLNNVTMLALVLAVGIVIDDAVVVLENIYRHVEEEGMPPRQAASVGTAEIALAVMATTLSLIIIFLPVAFMAGRVGRFFHSFGLTVAVAIFVSLLVSFTLTPSLSARMLRRRGGHASEGGRLYRLVERGYGRVLAWSLRHRWVIVLVAIAIVLATGPLFGRVGKTFLPQDDQSEFEISIRTPGGFTLAETSRLFAEIEHRVRALRGVTDVLATIGDTSGRVKAGEGDVTSGSIYARMVDLRARRFSQFDVMADARRLLTEYPDLRASVQGVNPFSTGGQRLSDVELNLRGPDLGRLQTYADRLMAGMRELPGLVDVDTTLAVRTAAGNGRRARERRRGAARHAAALQRAVDGARQDARREQHQLPARLRPEHRVHVHGARRAVRELHAPRHHHAGAAADGAVRAPLAHVARRGAQRVQHARSLHALRHRQEERHPADRLHEHAPRARRAARRGHPASQSRTSAADSDDHSHADLRHDADRARAGSGLRLTRLDRPRHRRRPGALAADHTPHHPR